MKDTLYTIYGDALTREGGGPFSATNIQNVIKKVSRNVGPWVQKALSLFVLGEDVRGTKENAKKKFLTFPTFYPKSAEAARRRKCSSMFYKWHMTDYVDWTV